MLDLDCSIQGNKNDFNVRERGYNTMKYETPSIELVEVVASMEDCACACGCLNGNGNGSC